MVDVVEKSSIIEDEERRTSRTATGRVSLFAALGLVLAILLPPAMLRPHVHGALPFDEAQLAELEAQAPDYIFIGNSMLHSRIDVDFLDRELGERCCFMIWTGGAESAWMHQALKNLALAAPHRPKKIFLFFRDTYLTMPSFRASDRYWWKIEQVSHDDEPDLMAALDAHRSWQENLEIRMGELYPVQRVRDRAVSLISSLAGAIATPGWVPSSDGSAGEKYDALFEPGKLRGADGADTDFEDVDASEFDFDARVGTSLLPSMIRMAKNAGVPLVFVRVQRRPTPTGPPPQPPQLQAYIEHLRRYLAANGEQFYDFTGDPELTLDRYLDGDHIRPSWKTGSTDLFLRRLRPAFQ